MKTVKILILLCVILQGCNRNKLSETPKYVGNSISEKVKYIAALHSLNMYTKTPNYSSDDTMNIDYFSEELAWAKYEGPIISPFSNTAFYLVSLNWVHPQNYLVVCAYADTMFVIPSDTTTINLLNQRLQYEIDFSIQQALLLLMLYNTLSSPGYKDEVILSSWRDIGWQKGEKVPQNIKGMIRKPQITSINNGYNVIAYVWCRGSGKIKNVTLTYVNRKIYLNVTILHSRPYKGIRL